MYAYRKFFSFFWVVLIGFLLISGCSSSSSSDDDSTDISLSGYVTNGPIAGATVTIYDSDGSSIGSTVTNEEGHFSVDNLPESPKYLITAEDGTLNGQVYEGTLSGVFSDSPANLTPITTVTEELTNKQAEEYQEIAGELMTWLELAEDPFLAASDNDFEEGLDLAVVREAIIQEGLNSWVEQMVSFYEQSASAEERGAGWFGIDPEPPIALASVITPLSDASVEIYDLYNMETPLYTTNTCSQGSFDIEVLEGFPEGTFLHVKVSGGTSTGSDDFEGAMPAGTEFQGVLHALVPIADHNAENFRVSVLTDIAYRYAQNLTDTRNLIGELPEGLIKKRLDYLSEVFVTNDIDGDDAIDSRDLIAFDPLNATHRDSLSFDFNLLTNPGESEQSILKSYYAGDKDVLLDMLEHVFGMKLSLNPRLDPTSDMVKVTLVATGEGRVTSDVGGFYYDTASEETTDHIQSVYLDRESTQTIVFTANPTEDTKILNWSGGDVIADDKTSCEVRLSRDRLVSIDFGYKETELKPDIKLVDLSSAEVSISSDQTEITVSPAPGDSQMKSILANLNPGDYVVGNQDQGFLRKINDIEDQGQDTYLLTTDDASLDEVIGQGSAHFKLQATHADFDANDQSPASLQAPLSDPHHSPRRMSVSTQDIETAEGVRLLPSTDPSDTTFTFIIGEPRLSEGLAAMPIGDGMGRFVWKDPNTGVTATVSGSVDISIALELGVDIGWGGLRTFKFVPVIEAVENLDVEFGGEWDWAQSEEIAIFPLGNITFFIGPVPVVVTPTLGVTLGIEADASGEISTGVELTQTASAGVFWDGDFTPISSFEYGYNYQPPTVGIEAYVKPYITPAVGMILYGATGPFIDIKGYFNLRGELASGEGAFLPGTEIKCYGGVNLTAKWGVEPAIGWDLSAASRFTNLIGADSVENPRYPVVNHEELIRSWNIGGDCADVPPYLHVADGPSFINAQVDFGSSATINETITFTNTGDQKMEWRVTSLFPAVGVISYNNLSSLSGTLGPAESDSINIKIDPPWLVGMSYNNYVLLNNLTDTSKEGGSRIIPVSILQLNERLAKPTIQSARLAQNAFGDTLKSQVDLSWWWSDPQNEGELRGFRIFSTTTPNDDNSWSVDIVTDPRAREHRIMGLSLGTTYYFRMQAYGTNGNFSDASDRVSITTSQYTTESKAYFWLLDQDSTSLDTPLNNIDRDGVRFTLDSVDYVVRPGQTALDANTWEQYAKALRDEIKAMVGNGVERMSSITVTVDWKNIHQTYNDAGVLVDIPAITLTDANGSPFSSLGFTIPEDLSGEFNVFGRFSADP